MRGEAFISLLERFGVTGWSSGRIGQMQGQRLRELRPMGAQRDFGAIFTNSLRKEKQN
jgi:hypothetical protein